MKRIIFKFTSLCGILLAICQQANSAPPATGGNGNSGALGVYGQVYAGSTTINSGGNILVSGATAVWVLGGALTSADKGTPTTPTTAGRSEVITFDNGGSATNPTGFVIDGYAGTSNQSAAITIPVGALSGGIYNPFPITVPAGQNVVTAFFYGSGSSTQTVGLSSATIYPPFYDFKNSSSVTGSFTLSYPGSVTSSGNDYIVGSTNATAGNGTGTFTLLTNKLSPGFGSGTVTATMTLPSGASRAAFATASSVLPVTLASFTGAPAQCAASLAWATSIETSFSGFGVQYAADGVNFTTVGTVASKGSSLGSSYSYSYNQPAGEGWYRLKMTDLDGSATFSPIVTVTTSCNAPAVLSVYPNPTSNMVTVAGIVGKSQIRVVNSFGQVLQTVEAAQVSQTINISSLPKAVYLLQVVKDGAVQQSFKVLKN